MTDKNTEISQASAATTPVKPGPATSAPKPASKAPKAAKARSPWLPAFIVVLIIAAILAALVWYQQKQFEQTRAQLISQVQSSNSTVSQAVEQSRQALALTQEQSGQISALENSLRQFQGQVDGLDQAFQTLTDSGSDLVLINDVDHLVTIAQQQLQLGGNVANAVISLETAQAQLARANRPALASLQQTLNGDLDRLRATSTIDIAALSTQLDELSGLVSEAPLMVPDDAAPEPVPAPHAAATTTAPANEPQPAQNDSAPWWQQSLDTALGWSKEAWDSVRQDLGEFITVRRVDDATALLMSPDQATRFRETLRLRVMTAQLALMMKQPKIWQAETAALVTSIESRFDERSAQTRRALKIARQMADTNIDAKLPTVDNTIQALEVLRAEQVNRQKLEGTQADTPASGPEQIEQTPDASQPVQEAPEAVQPEQADPAQADSSPVETAES
ncbi:uroporphyrinogen-III C-methyltransferase [Pusillimonas sp. MFBS29]|uniref:uroporphyrinogen-III C-methyltransferase n=1 Tax=Pusillimonas sp. MFBS29 TaxID=2886690 RepID=UPI001D119569|nr:uroporphyrinogen-III C-methyltransferase [Pusillimonas sp. MFBS29]MCC2595385.1 uroporphyrinogen-III C-methyltransferase [Pusillimonas sp. MFBS29]